MTPQQKQTLHRIFVLVGLGLLALVISPIQFEEHPPASNRNPQVKPITEGQPDAPLDPDQSLEATTIEETKVTWDSEPNSWIRTLILSSEKAPRKLRVVERWAIDPIQQKPTRLSRQTYLANQLIVRTRDSSTTDQLAALLVGREMRIGKSLSANLYTIELENSGIDAIPHATAYLSQYPHIVDTVEGDGYGFGGGDPNDSRFGEQWGLKNTGQNDGTLGADVNASAFWEILEHAPDVVVAVLDSGLNFNHPDLLGISWKNPEETAKDGIDNDGNGWVDDVHGWDFVNDDNDPLDDHGHGSNVTGIIAANRNNGTGIAGLLSGVRILTCKILNSNNRGSTSDLISGIRYARSQNVSVMNLSLQNYPYSQIVDDEISLCEEKGIVLVICAGNQGTDNDSVPNYPSSYPHANIISVANHDRRDERWAGSFNPSNFGKESVDLFAPGRRIVSPILGSSYSAYTGTSQATPFVTSICAAIKQVNPAWQPPEIKSAILDTVAKRESYAGLCTSGGRLDAATALAQSIVSGEDGDNDHDGFPNAFELLAGTRIDHAGDFPMIDVEIGNETLGFSLPRDERDDLKFVAEKSTNLIDWISNGLVETSTSDQFEAYTQLGDEKRIFLRIRSVKSP